MVHADAEGSAERWEPPSHFDQFDVLEPIGRGGMGHVYLGRDLDLDRLVALKFISSANPGERARQRFLREARAIARLSHPNVVAVYRIGDVAGLPYIAYEFVSGQSLDKIRLPVGWQTGLRLAIGMARGLEAAHREGMLHRDIKPGNAMLSDRGEVKLLDFGLAKLAVEPASERPGSEGGTSGTGATGVTIVPAGSLPPRGPRAAYATTVAQGEGSEADAPPPSLGRRALTRPGTLIGTPGYMAPELWLGEGASTRSDVYAFGLVLYELLAGRLPHALLSDDDLARVRIETDLPPLRVTVAEVPQSLAAVVDRAVRRNPAERFDSAAELRAALDEVAQVFLPATAGLDVIQMDPERVAVASSFTRVRAQGDAFIAAMYDRVFSRAPDARPLFPADMTEQRKKLLHMLTLATDALRDPDRMAPVLEDLGQRHVGYGVSDAHFAVLESALLDSLAEFDAAAWTPELARAWRRGFAFIESAMRSGMRRAQTTRPSGEDSR